MSLRRYILRQWELDLWALIYPSQRWSEMDDKYSLTMATHMKYRYWLPWRAEYNPDINWRDQMKCHIADITMPITMNITMLNAILITMPITKQIIMLYTMQITMPITKKIIMPYTMQITILNKMPYLCQSCITKNTPKWDPNTDEVTPNYTTTMPIDNWKSTLESTPIKPYKKSCLWSDNFQYRGMTILGFQKTPTANYYHIRSAATQRLNNDMAMQSSHVTANTPTDELTCTHRVEPVSAPNDRKP